MIKEICFMALWYLLQIVALGIFSFTLAYLFCLLKDIRKEQKLYKEINNNYKNYWINRNLK
ncbi:MAG: hypothetical protein QXO70_00920 [Candidatus Pacearchaeota archaeon]